MLDQHASKLRSTLALWLILAFGFRGTTAARGQCPATESAKLTAPDATAESFVNWATPHVHPIDPPAGAAATESSERDTRASWSPIRPWLQRGSIYRCW